jgi:hypothetical protein
VPPDSLEPWLLRMLDSWRRSNPDSLVEPWDWYYPMGHAGRTLSRTTPRDRLIQLNNRIYRSLGADVKALRVRYDVEQREGKTPVAYTTFGARPRLINGSWRAGDPEWGAGRWCDVFEIRDFLIQRVFIYLDPDYAGEDTDRYPWLAGRS